VSLYSFSDDSLSAMRIRLRTVGLNLLTFLSGGAVNHYRPELHHMRGPGPKWREKHAKNTEGVGFVQTPVFLNDRWDP
jgi:hypothetical protein